MVTLMSKDSPNDELIDDQTTGCIMIELLIYLCGKAFRGDAIMRTDARETLIS